MGRSSFAHMNCPIARALDVIGEWWSLLIIREAFFGTHRFNDFQANLGIAPTVLTQRLNKLVEHGVLEVPTESLSGKALDYRLTPKGRDLFPALVALAQWGDRYEEHPNGSPTRVVEIATGQEVAPMGMRSADGQSLDLKDVAIVPGPGASERDRRRLLARRTAADPTETVGKHLTEDKLA